jgi:site-specific recombinase XerD
MADRHLRLVQPNQQQRLEISRDELRTLCMRHSYLTHTAEAGRDPAWRQRQAGHKLMSTTSLYTHTSEDFMNRELATAIADLTGRRGSET